jgi:hypothetical protein
MIPPRRAGGQLLAATGGIHQSQPLRSMRAALVLSCRRIAAARWRDVMVTERRQEAVKESVSLEVK